MEKKIFKYNLGDRAKDKISGLTGIICARAQYLTGCVHYGICPEKISEKQSTYDWTYLDASRLEILEEKAVDIQPAEDAPSGPCDNPPEN